MESWTGRIPDTGGSIERILTQEFVDLATGERKKSESYTIRGHPAQFIRLTDIGGVLTSADYPATITVGTGSSSTTVKLGGGAPVFDPVGMLAYVTAASDANGKGQVRVVKNLATDVITVDAWSNSYVPASGDTVELLIDCRGRSTLLVRSEFEANDGTCTWVPVFFDHARDPSKGSGTDDGQMGLDTVKRAPIQYLGAELDPYAYTRSVGDLATGGAFFVGRTVPEDTRGAMGAKLWLKTVPPASKKVLAWACAV